MRDTTAEPDDSEDGIHGNAWEPGADDPPAPGCTKERFETSNEKPQALAVNPDGIPAELKAKSQWVVWKFVYRDGRWTKVPIDPKTGGNAKADGGKSQLQSAEAKATWGTFDQAYGAYAKHPNKLAGIGFEFSPDGDEAGVDLDDAIDAGTGELKPWAAVIVKDFDSYTELSPSGTGVKIYLRGKKPGDRCSKRYQDGKIEIYDQGRFFAVTGHRVEVVP